MDLMDFNKILKENTFDYPHFSSFREKYFPHIKIKKFKNLIGKRWVCSILNELRMKFRNQFRRNLCAQVFALHKSGLFMIERLQYYISKLYRSEWKANSNNDELFQYIQMKIYQDINKRIGKLKNNELIEVAQTLNNALSKLATLKLNITVNKEIINNFFQLFQHRETRKTENITKKNVFEGKLDYLNKSSIYCSDEIKALPDWNVIFDQNCYAFIPIYISFEECWVLDIINCKKKVIELFSTTSTINTNHKCLVQWRIEWMESFTSEDDWPFGETFFKDYEDNDDTYYNSRIHVMMFADFKSNHIPYLVEIDDIVNMRNRICFIIQNESLSY